MGARALVNGAMATSIDSAERDRLARLFADIASEAGAAAMEVYATDFQMRSKADSTPVSDADERAEEIILARLAREMPGVPVLAEETASREGVAAQMADVFLLVDPIDGTKEFMKRSGDFTVNIALVEAKRPIAGCVYAPARGEMFLGGTSAWALRGFSAGSKLATAAASLITTRNYPPDGLIAVTSSSHLDAQTVAFLERLGVTKRTGIGSSLKFCLLASGEADVYPRWGPTMEWDTAAGHAVLQAAGGQVLQPDGQPFLYGDGANGYRNGPFIAWGRQPL